MTKITHLWYKADTEIDRTQKPRLNPPSHRNLLFDKGEKNHIFEKQQPGARETCRMKIDPYLSLCTHTKKSIQNGSKTFIQAQQSEIAKHYRENMLRSRHQQGLSE